MRLATRTGVVLYPTATLAGKEWGHLLPEIEPRVRLRRVVDPVQNRVEPVVGLGVVGAFGSTRCVSSG